MTKTTLNIIGTTLLLLPLFVVLGIMTYENGFKEVLYFLGIIFVTFIPVGLGVYFLAEADSVGDDR